MQLAASGSPARAATRAITSLPRSVPAATTAVAPMRSAVSADDRAPRRRARSRVSPSCAARRGRRRRRARAAPLVGADQQRLRRARPSERARAVERLQRRPRRPPRWIERRAVHQATPICSSRSTTAGAASAPSPRTSACLALPSGTTRRTRSRREAGRARRRRVDAASTGPHAAGHRRVARQVEALEHRHDGGQRQRVDVAAAARLLLAAHAAPPSTATPLRPVAHGRPSARATRRPTWKPPESADSLPKKIRSNGPVAASSARDRRGDRGRGRLRIPLAAVGLEVDGAARCPSPSRRAAARRPRPGRA